MQNQKIWDVIIIGGGPAGMMAAGKAAERGKSVLLLEKNPTLGKKLLITGGGRCNVTNYKPELHDIVASYKNKPKALYSIFSQLNVEETISFFNSRGMDTKIEAEGRVFPTSDSAQSVWNTLYNYMLENKVNIKTNSNVLGIEIDENKNFCINTKSGIEVSKSCIVATGGTSRPDTGSTGEGFKWLKNLGHSITENNFALVPISIKENWIKSLAGLALTDVKINVFLENKKQFSKKGKVLFTHVGLSGPAILNLSSQVKELLEEGKVIIELDLFCDLDFAKLKELLNSTLEKENNKKIKNTLGNLIPSSLVKSILELTEIDPEKPNNIISKEERKRLIQILKSIKLTVKGLLGADKAIVSSGGVKIEEVDFKTMESKIIKNLYLVGDVLDIDRPSGGYSLQICWSSGYVAGSWC